MIVRMWRGWAPVEIADEYRRHYETVIAGHLRKVDGFRGAQLLRQDDGREVLFTSVIFFADMDVVRRFFGEELGFGAELDRADVAEDARRVLSRWDERVTYHEVAVDIT
jgi:hypothetical protein